MSGLGYRHCQRDIARARAARQDGMSVGMPKVTIRECDVERLLVEHDALAEEVAQLKSRLAECRAELSTGKARPGEQA